MNKNQRFTPFLKGLRDGLPIGAGYFAVAFGLGIAAQKTGMTPPFSRTWPGNAWTW